jgi:hypothetical protein
VMSQLMERLSKYAAASPEVLPEFLQVEAFTKFSHAVVEVNVINLSSRVNSGRLAVLLPGLLPSSLAS